MNAETVLSLKARVSELMEQGRYAEVQEIQKRLERLEAVLVARRQKRKIVRPRQSSASFGPKDSRSFLRGLKGLDENRRRKAIDQRIEILCARSGNK